MAPRKDRRARSRKRRRSGARHHVAAPERIEPASPAPEGRWHSAVQEARATPGRAPRGAATRPERPRPPWHPLPLAEILIVAGTVAFVIGIRRGTATAAGRTPLLVGIAAVGIGTLEFSLREHRSGFRSHATLLAVLPVVVFHTIAVLVISAFIHVGSTINLTIVAVDVVLFAILFRLLRMGYVRARHDRSVRPPRRAG